MSHAPVMCSEVVTALDPQSGQTYVDGTFGGGGYTRAVLAAADCHVYGIDRDLEAITRAETLAGTSELFTPILGRFGDLDTLLINAGEDRIDGVMLDIGVSSFQIDEAARGFSFMRNGPLDMRMGQTGPSAADVVNLMPEKDLGRLIRALGDEKQARRIARAIVERRANQPFTQTLDLAEVIEDAVGGRRGRKTHPATQSFQAIRIFVNEELDELARGLMAAERILAPGGRLVVVTFHSLEDRIVKQFLRERSGSVSQGSRYRPTLDPGPDPTFALAHRKPLEPQPEERLQNPRARSARLRAATRTEAPAWATAIDPGFNLPGLQSLEVTS